ncbi:ABC transporter permease [Sabulicella glaciei]|uniref:ABC transporter permease n=1 Tax=Sabulicella glaciei TaxID=2984948 RepID=A0ABT3NVT0_9PROT|nr:ABC transporter permease [Roseococcus sp. MDT2-1-1]MCW8086272.1 ABC transporter permease [Roseococcus sp. MDT2-1-1]
MAGEKSTALGQGAPGLLRGLALPAWLCGLAFAAALLAVFQYALRAHVPGELEPGGFTLQNFVAQAHPLYIGVFWDTLLLCAGTAILSLLAGYPLAWAILRTRSRLARSMILAIVITPLFLGEIVRTYGWIVVLGNSGFLNAALAWLGLGRAEMLFTTGGVLAALVHVTLPIVVIMLAAGLAHIEPELERAAQSLGATPARGFFTVTLPLSLPGILAAGTTAFAWTFSAFATPQLVGGGKVNMISNLVYQLGFASFNFPFAAALAVSGLALTAVSLAALSLVTRRVEQRL